MGIVRRILEGDFMSGDFPLSVGGIESNDIGQGTYSGVTDEVPQAADREMAPAPTHPEDERTLELTYRRSEGRVEGILTSKDVTNAYTYEVSPKEMFALRTTFGSGPFYGPEANEVIRWMNDNLSWLGELNNESTWNAKGVLKNLKRAGAYAD